MYYTFDIVVNCIETRKNYSICPDKMHSHKIFFTLTLEAGEVSNEEELLEKVSDSVSETVFLFEPWNLKMLTETMMQELRSQEFKIVKIKSSIAEIPISFEVTNV